MVEAIGGESNTCGNPEDLSGTIGSCAKQEPMYDSITSGFIMPEPEATVIISVCNNNVYAVGQWLQFASPFVTLQVVEKDGNGKNLTLRNACPNGDDIEDNPAAGSITVSKSSIFTVVSQPACTSDESRQEEINKAFSEMTELCIPNLEESEDGSTIQMTGRVETNPNDTGFKKCIRRIKGFLFKEGMPLLPGFTRLPTGADPAIYDSVVIHSTTGQTKVKNHPSKTPNLAAGKRYVQVYTSGAEVVAGPAYVQAMVRKVLVQSGSMLDVASLTDIAQNGTFTESFNLNIPEITDLLGQSPGYDHFYVDVLVRVGIYNTANNPQSLYTITLNDQDALMIGSSPFGSRFIEQVVIPIKVMRSDMLLNFKMVTVTNSARKHMRKVEILGVKF